MLRIPIKTSCKSYNVIIDRGLLARAGAAIRDELSVPCENCFVISSESIWSRWGEPLVESLNATGLCHHHILLPDGEQAKRLSTIESAADQMVKLRADRNTIVIAFGGGVIGDVAGFLAATYMRGVRCVQVPTTLLAQVDASIGGKTGVNLASGKNLLGSFHQPECVLIDPAVLTTLSDREYRAGLYEVIKCGAIADPSLFSHARSQQQRILAREPDAVLACISASVRVKANIVSKDEHESGLRRILNFGHTIGHALEVETGYAHFLHGEAVAWGMIAATHIGRALDISDSESSDSITRVVLSYGALPSLPRNAEAIVDRVAADKKTIAGKNRFIVVPSIGRAEIVADVPREMILDAVRHIQQIASSQA